MSVLFGIVGAVVGLIVGFAIAQVILGGGRHMESRFRTQGFRSFLGAVIIGCAVAGAWIGASLR